MQVQIDELAAPAAVAPSASSYVVWARKPGGGAVENVGAMRMRDDQGVLEAVAPFGPFHLFVTAEASAEVARPTGRPLFSANVLE